MRPVQPVLGVILIVGSVFLMSFGDALIKYNSASFTAWQIFALRSAITVPILFALLLALAPGGSLIPRSPRWVGLRSTLLVLMWIAYYAALPLISLSAAAVAFYTAPLFIALLSRSLTGEPVGPARWLGIVLGFLGVLIVLRPGSDTFSAAALLPVLAAFLYALAAIITRARCAGERPLVLALGLNLGLLVAGLIASTGLSLVPPAAADVAAHPFLFGPWATMGGREWALMALLALLMVAFGTGVAMAYQIAPAALIGTFDYTYVVFAVVWSYVLFAERPDAPAIVGLLLIAAAGALVAGRPVKATTPTDAEVTVRSAR
jgi:drug/metabolite transporter (DMT)-like permease